LQQLSRQVTDLSAAGANLFYAVVELQRLRAATERKFQRWFLETRKDAERQQEIAVALEKSLIEERKSRMDDVARMEGSVAVLSRQTIEYKRELVSSRDESKRAWEALGRIEQETRENRKETEKRKLELEEKIRELAVQKGLAISFRKQLDTQIEDSNREITERDDLVVSLHRQLKAERSRGST
jgi:hypothetical protein